MSHDNCVVLQFLQKKDRSVKGTKKSHRTQTCHESRQTHRQSLQTTRRRHSMLAVEYSHNLSMSEHKAARLSGSFCSLRSHSSRSLLSSLTIQKEGKKENESPIFKRRRSLNLMFDEDNKEEKVEELGLIVNKSLCDTSLYSPTKSVETGRSKIRSTGKTRSKCHNPVSIDHCDNSEYIIELKQ